jgi:hypothetical protein
MNSPPRNQNYAFILIFNRPIPQSVASLTKRPALANADGLIPSQLLEEHLSLLSWS